MAEPIINANTGKTPAWGFATDAVSNLHRESEDVIETGERDELIGEDDTTQAVIYTDLGKQVALAGTMLTGYTAPAIGAAMTAGGISGYVMESAISRSRNLNRVRLMVELPDAITAIS